MNLKRAIGGFLLSFVFLLFFTYIIFGIQGVFDNFLQNQNKEVFLGSVSGGLQNITSENTTENINQSVPIESSGLEVNAQSAISIWTNLLDTDKVLFNKNDQRILSVASISKLMTALVVVENYDLSQKIKISNKAANQTINLEPLKEGEIFFAKDLLYAMLVGSDNTASYALSESIGTDKFVELMNEKAKDIGLFDTSFLNPTGLGLDNFSTAQDLSKLAEYLLKEHPFIFEITTTPEFNIYTVDDKILHKINNTDELLIGSPDLAKRIIGGKTGETRTAGECLLLVVKPLNNQGYLINVILNSNDKFGETKKIINWIDTTQF